MTDARLRVVAVAPGGDGLYQGLTSCVHAGSVVSAYSDSRLKLASELLDENEEIEFLPFGELVGKVLRMTGAPCGRLVTRGQLEAMTLLACQSINDGTALSNACKLRGTASLVRERGEDLRRHGIDSQVLRAASESIGGPLGQKCSTLAEIYDLVSDSKDASKRESVADRIERCLEVGAGEMGPLGHVVVIAGPDEAPVYDSWLNWLAGQGIDIDVLAEVLPGRTDLFESSQRTIARLAARKRTVIGGQAWFESLFTSQTSDGAPQIEIFRAADPLGECEWTVRRCLDEQRGGTPWTAMGIFVRDMDRYAPLMTAAAQRLGLSLSSSRTVPLLSSGLANIVYETLKACADGDVRKVARLGKSTYCLTSHEEFWTLWEQASLVSRGGRNGWGQLEEWLADCGLDLKWLRALVAWKSKYGKDAAKLSVWLEALRELVGETAIPDTAPGDDVVTLARDNGAKTVLQRSIADMAFVYDQAGNKELNLNEFASLAGSIWEDETLSIQTDKGGVLLCHDEASLPNFEVLFVPGMLEGALPRRRSEDPLLSDEDRAELSHFVGVKISDSRDASRAERDNFVRLCAAAKRKIVLSHPMTDDDRDQVPAFYLEEIRRVVGLVHETTHARNDLVPPTGAYFAPADEHLANALSGPRTNPTRPRLQEPWAKELVQPDWARGASVEEFGTALACPFQSSFLYRLDVRSPLRRIGTFILFDLPRRARLAERPDVQTATIALTSELEELLDGVAPNLDAWEVALLRASGQRWIKEWVEREFRSRALWPRSESKADMTLGDEDLKDSLSINRHPVKLKAKLTGATTVEDFSVFQFYEPGSLRFDDFAQKVENDPEDLVWGLYLMCQFARRPRGSALEIDLLSGQRLVGVLKNEGATGLRSDQHHGLAVKNLGSPGTVLRTVKRRLTEAVKVMDAATCAATPGAHCERCRYGEICRVSSEFGEQDTPVGEDEET